MSKDYIASGFFALRTPLLPFDELLSWNGEALSANRPATVCAGCSPKNAR